MPGVLGVVPEVLGNKRGRKPGGAKTGGRTKGTVNKLTPERRDLITQALGSGISPLEYMLNVMRDDAADDERRDWAAQNAAPYIHPRLQAIAYKPMNDNEEFGKKMDDLTRVRNLLFAVELIKRKPTSDDVVDALPIEKD